MRRRQLLGLAASALPFGLLLAWSVAPAEAIGGVLPELDKLAPSFDLDGVAPPQVGLSTKDAASPIPVRLRNSDFQGRWLVLYF